MSITFRCSKCDRQLITMDGEPVVCGNCRAKRSPKAKPRR